jgi:hypothetical protein
VCLLPCTPPCALRLSTRQPNHGNELAASISPDTGSGLPVAYQAVCKYLQVFVACVFCCLPAPVVPCLVVLVVSWCERVGFQRIWYPTPSHRLTDSITMRMDSAALSTPGGGLHTSAAHYLHHGSQVSTLLTPVWWLVMGVVVVVVIPGKAWGLFMFCSGLGTVGVHPYSRPIGGPWPLSSMAPGSVSAGDADVEPS